MAEEDAVYEMTIDQENLPKGEPIQIAGLGTFENGITYTISKEEADAYRVYHTQHEDVIDADTQAVLGTEAVAGPTLLQASKNMYGVEVTTFESKSGSDPNARNSKKATTVSDDDTSKQIPNAEPATDAVAAATDTSKKTKGGAS